MDDEAGTTPHDDATEWDGRYARSNQWWSGRPNGGLVAEAGQLRAGSALDVGCGEGADAIWLAQQGWRVTALDISGVAVARGRRGADEAGVEIEWHIGDLAAMPEVRSVGYDLVSLQYPALRRTAADVVIGALLGAVAPGGRLLVVGHDLAAGAGHEHLHDFDPAEYVQPPDVAARLDDEWQIEVQEVRPRRWPEEDPSRHSARRRPPSAPTAHGRTEPPCRRGVTFVPAATADGW